MFEINTRLFKASVGRPPKGPTGFSGETSLDEPIEQEYLSDLQGEKGMEVYETMRRSDGSVHAALTAVKLPILRANWRIEPASDRSKDRKLAEEIERTLFRNEKDWQSSLREILTCLDFGFSLFEPLYEIEGTKVTLKKIAFRPQKTIAKWKTGAKGDLTGVEQRTTVGGIQADVTIPIENLLVFSNDKEGKNWWGVSLLRTAYKHWKMKTRLENLAAVSADRYALGVPVITLPEGTWRKEDREVAKRIGRNLRANEQAYIVKPAGFDVQILSVANTRADLLPDIRYHEQQITRNVLAGFLDLGTTESGSRAVAGELKEFFLMSLQSIADHVAQVVTRHLVEKLAVWNYGPSVEPPELKAEKISHIDLEEWSRALHRFSVSGLLQVDDELESFVRDVAGLPEIDLKQRKKEREQFPAPEVQRPDEMEPTAETEEEPEQGKQASVQSCDCDRKTAARFHRGEPLEERLKRASELELAVDWRRIASRQDRETETAGDIALAIQERMIEEINSGGAKLTPEKLEKLVLDDPEGRGKLTKKLAGVFKFGQDQVAAEVKRQTGRTAARKKQAARSDNWLLDIEDLVKIVTFKISTRLKTNAAGTIADSSWEKLTDKQKAEFLVQRLGGLSDAVALQMVREAVGTAFSRGRDDEGRRLFEEGVIEETVVGSSILDDNLCDACASDIDGQEFKIGSAEYDEHLPPYSNCEGGAKCRCAYIYVGK